MVSQWMPYGNMLGYVTKHPGANRLQLVRLTYSQLYLPLTIS